MRMDHLPLVICFIAMFFASSCLSTCDRRVVKVERLAYPVSFTGYIELAGKSESLEKIAVKHKAFEVKHRYWSLVNGLWSLGDNDAIIDKLNEAITEAKGDYAGNVEIIMETCWLNYTPFAYLLIQPTCIDLIMKGDIYSKK